MNSPANSSAASADQAQQAADEHAEISELRAKLKRLHSVHQLQTGALAELRQKHETCEGIAQSMALQLHQFAEVFAEENKRLDPPLPLDAIHALLSSWRSYVDQTRRSNHDSPN